MPDQRIYLAGQFGNVPGSSYSSLSGMSKIVTKDSGRVIQVKYYSSYNSETQSLAGIVCKEDYFYSGNKITQINVTWYEGNEDAPIGNETVTFETDQNNPNMTREIRVVS